MHTAILNLHGLGRPPQPLPDGEARYWVGPDLLAAAIELAAKHRDEVRTLFTFDDGNRSDIEIGAPMLAAAGHQATIFVLADRIDAPHYLSQDDISALQAMGHAIGSHGAAHLDWTAQDATTLDRELGEARVRIETVAGHSVTEAAIPFGRYNARVLKALRQAGFSRVYSSDGGVARMSAWPVARTSLTDKMTPASLEAIITGREAPTRRLRRRVAVAVKSRI
ncbi:polysaccharide deacetylase family protein [uncultured Limimaricola sp.]|uniref:polysaccharide deacetylase family protein n=1 Tax=uncultured Limimaricola sp. TaxID=2211667 RepID=UPI0030FB5949